MPSPVPERNRNVYFVGAGLSCALGLPNTAMLLEGVLALASRAGRWQRERLDERLRAAFEFFYPDAVHAGYMPDVVDFFSALRTYLDVGADLAGGFRDAAPLHRALKFAIANLLIEGGRACEATLRHGHPFLDEMLQPGNIVVTSNWDLLLERYAQLRKIPLRLSGSGTDEIVLLKLHGSIDWCLGGSMRRKGSVGLYAMLSERLFGPRPYRPSLPARAARAGVPVRIRAIESRPGAWNLVLRSRASELLMVTMARGKAGDIGPLRSVWRDAYGAISRAQRLEIVGYAMPPDDTEIRTLLRAGVQRGSPLDEVVVRNPAPDVHERVRRYLDRSVNSDYRGVNTA
jgi:hypothetical protein